MNGFRNFDGFFSSLGKIKESIAESFRVPPCVSGLSVKFTTPVIDLKKDSDNILSVVVSPPLLIEEQVFSYIRYAIELWDFRTGEHRYRWSKLYEASPLEDFEMKIPKKCRYFRAEYYSSEMDTTKFGCWTDSL